MIEVNRDIAQMKPYVPGKPISEVERELGISGAIKLASNENPLGPSKKALKAVREGLNAVSRYPEGGGSPLRKALADQWKVSVEHVLLGNGSNEVIELLVRTFVMPGDEAIMAKPTFSLYGLMVQSGHGKVIEVPLKDGRHDLAAMKEGITSKTKLIFICNPNNPTGTIVYKKEVRAFLSDLPKHVLVVFDEAYAEYVTDIHYPDTIDFLKEGTPLIMLRTFSKIYGLAGLRIGYGVSHPDVISYMNRVRQPFNSNSPGQQGALAALSDEAHFARSKAVNQTGKAFLCKHFDTLGISYYPSESNFIYFYFEGNPPDTGSKIHDGLLQKGVIIRHFGGSFLRVTIGRPSENQRFINALKEVLLTVREKSRRD
ncbi:MAG: histidinol-phosphate transaminase [Nitrospiria bacterium]